jgi:hypothetical protein
MILFSRSRTRGRIGLLMFLATHRINVYQHLHQAPQILLCHAQTVEIVAVNAVVAHGNFLGAKPQPLCRLVKCLHVPVEEPEALKSRYGSLTKIGSVCAPRPKALSLDERFKKDS